ncbi:Eco57I restriction-modification methylase domain-containing protein [Faecalispora jeddahensis]|uniref:Eco57I restriction-modification methylase domain-containing protein n=1 Tax=Faecalispora jeddahensis TaxID=1414721 RepID=UPI001FACA71B|nr:class I SAM-dependent DNA methyltransferase [Faecalispora jeddahensis]
MSMDLTGINNINEYYTNHYFASIFAENAEETISAWRVKAKDSNEYRTPWARLRDCGRQYYVYHDKEQRGRSVAQIPAMVKNMADMFLAALDYPEAAPKIELINDVLSAPVYLEVTKANGAPLLWVILTKNTEDEAAILEGCAISAPVGDDENAVSAFSAELDNEELATKILFAMDEPPRWLVFIGLHQIALIDRNKWNEKRYLSFDLADIFSRHEESTLQAMSVLLHKDNLCPAEGGSLLDQLDENSHRHASGVSQDLKYALRESIELLGNEILYDLSHRQGRDLDANPVDAGELTIQCLRYMYRMLFMLFIEARPELGYAPMKAQSYVQGYSLESLRDVADSVREETSAVGDGYYLHETLSKLYDLIYSGYPSTEEELHKLQESESLNDIFIIEPLKAHIFDPELTPLITAAKLRNSVMLRIIDLMSVSRPSGRRNERRGRISYSTLGINQMGAVYEALLSYRGFIAEDDLYEVKRAGDRFNELDVGYFVKENELSQYTEDERVRYESGENAGKLRMHKKGTFIYRLAGREREKSASYYTPEVLTKCLVKYALKELLEEKTADEILHLTICEPAMGSAAFLNEAINQLAEAYIDRKQKELGETISYEKRFDELQRVKMYIADRNVYGIDLNPVAVELAEVSLWLNTIFSGGFVPWFGMQLVCGNSLIGARRQCYTVSQLQANGSHWYDSAPERVPVGTKRKPKSQVYHFFTGDTGMSNYTDKVIKSLAPDDIKAIKSWNKQFTKPFTDDDVKTALRLSEVVDKLWEQVIALRREIDEKTSDPLTVYGQPAETAASHTTIREKDMIYKKLYLSEEMRNAGPYARLKFAMDYWCALWFWPIEKADLLPSRSEFLADMGFILEGTIDTFAAVSKEIKMGQLSLFPSEAEQLVMDMTEQYRGMGVVDIPKLCEQQPRLALVRQIAEQNHFMHWELEFADLFADRGGFDLMIGNPPWIKTNWNEMNLLADMQPLFAVKKFSSAKTNEQRSSLLKNSNNICQYMREYEGAAGIQNFFNSACVYNILAGVQTNLYKCFLPQAWTFTKADGFFAFVHPDSIFDDPGAGRMREILYRKMRYHFQFINEKLLFQEVSDTGIFGLNVYSNVETKTFDMISNLYAPSTIDQCYSGENAYSSIPLIKDSNGDWNTQGHPKRIVKIDARLLKSIATVYDDPNEYEQTRLPAIYSDELLSIIAQFAKVKLHIADFGENVFMTQFLDETGSQKDGIISRYTHFVDDLSDFVYSGPHISIANPLFKTPRAVCIEKADFDRIDLEFVSRYYMQRSNYEVNQKLCAKRTPITPWGEKYTEKFRVVTRRMLGLNQERTLMSAIVPPKAVHIIGVFGICFSNDRNTVLASALFNSLPYDYLIRALGRASFLNDSAKKMPFIDNEYSHLLVCRALLLNCLTARYEALWKKCFDNRFLEDGFFKQDKRLHSKHFEALTAVWNEDIPVRSDFARRQLLIEIDVIVAKSLELTIYQLKNLYKAQFPVLNKYEEDTWYDANGRIVFTINKGLPGVGFTRPEFENSNVVTPIHRSDAPWDGIMKHAPAGYVFARTITDDTMPGGPIERTIEYVAPFDRCDREQDYETAWKFFEEKYGGQA